jgi:hypothetical protein
LRKRLEPRRYTYEVWLRGATYRATAAAVSVGRNPKLFRGE